MLPALALFVMQTGTATSVDRVQGWRIDLQVFRATLETQHANAFTHLSKADFHRDLDMLSSQVTSIPDHQIVTKMLRLIAKIRDGHTNLIFDPAKMGMHRVPIDIRWFKDGWYVVAASRRARLANGKRLSAIGGMPVASAVEWMKELAPYDNESSRLQRIPIYFRTAEFLVNYNIADDVSKVRILVHPIEGYGADVIDLYPMLASQAMELDPAVDRSKLLSRKYANENYAFEFVPASKALYIAYNRCQPDPDIPMVRFAEAVKTEAETRGAKAFIVDLRLNGGGASVVLSPLIKVLGSSGKRVFVLIGRGTYSSAVMNAQELRKRANAVLVGEPTGGTLNGYGEVKRVVLPYSGMSLQYSTKLFKDADTTDAVYPDVTIWESSRDYFAGKDEVLDTVLRSISRG